MAKTYCRWKQEEIKKLFNFIQQQTKTGTSLTKAFSLYANASGRKPNSVRNYYYAELAFLEQNPNQAKQLGINLLMHNKVSPKYFSDEEAQKCVEEINKLVSQGNSVRKACLTLSNGNISEMVRLQNKYRSLTKKTKLQKEQKKQEAQLPPNIISMPSRSKQLSQPEIDSLFLGLLKLIKMSARQEARQQANQELTKKADSANQLLRKTLVKLTEKEQQLQKLKASFELLQQENTKANQTIRKLRSTTAQKMAKSQQKMHALKKYTKQISQSKKQIGLNNNSN